MVKFITLGQEVGLGGAESYTEMILQDALNLSAATKINGRNADETSASPSMGIMQCQLINLI
jgi:hypothetical protein